MYFRQYVIDVPGYANMRFLTGPNRKCKLNPNGLNSISLRQRFAGQVMFSFAEAGGGPAFGGLTEVRGSPVPPAKSVRIYQILPRSSDLTVLTTKSVRTYSPNPSGFTILPSCPSVLYLSVFSKTCSAKLKPPAKGGA